MIHREIAKSIFYEWGVCDSVPEVRVADLEKLLDEAYKRGFEECQEKAVRIAEHYAMGPMFNRTISEHCDTIGNEIIALRPGEEGK